MVAVFLRARLHAGGIGAESRLGEPETSESFAGLQFRKPAIFLLVGSVRQDWIHHQRALHGGEAAESGIRALQFLHHQAVLHIAHAGATVAFQIRSEKTESADFRDQFLGEACVAKTIANQWNYAIFDKLAGSLPNQQFLLWEERVDQEGVDAGEARH